MPLMHMMGEGASATTDYQLRQLFATLGDEAGRQQYVRIQADLGGDKAAAKMDNASLKNMDNLVQIGLRTAKANREALTHFVDTQLVTSTG